MTSNHDKILDVVISLLDEDGFERFGVRQVAHRAHVSLETVYRAFPSRDVLIVTALVRWLETHGLSATTPPDADMSLRESLRYLVRQTFDPWERHPNLFRVYHRFLSVPAGGALHAQTSAALGALNLSDEMRRAKAILSDVAHAAGSRYTAGIIEVHEFREYLEEVIDWLTPGEATNPPLASTGARVDRTR
jgi:AcrR family transcriptional regulator